MHEQGETLVNVHTGDQITFLQMGADTDGALLRVEWVWQRKGSPPFTHRHTELQETFTPTEGRMGVRVGGEKRILAPGESVTVPPGVWHYFWNAGNGALRFRQEVRPAGRHQELFELTFALANTGRLAPRAMLADPATIAQIWHLNEGEFAGFPPVVQRCVVSALERFPRRHAANGGD